MFALLRSHQWYDQVYAEHYNCLGVVISLCCVCRSGARLATSPHRKSKKTESIFLRELTWPRDLVCQTAFKWFRCWTGRHDHLEINKLALALQQSESVKLGSWSWLPVLLLLRKCISKSVLDLRNSRKLGCSEIAGARLGMDSTKSSNWGWDIGLGCKHCVHPWAINCLVALHLFKVPLTPILGQMNSNPFRLIHLEHSAYCIVPE